MQLERVFEVQRETLHFVGICYARENDETNAMNYFD